MPFSFLRLRNGCDIYAFAGLRGSIDCVEDLHQPYTILRGSATGGTVHGSVHESGNLAAESVCIAAKRRVGGNFHEHTGQIGVHFHLVIDCLDPRFRAKQLNTARVAVDIQIEAGFHLERKAVFKPYDGIREVFNGVVITCFRRGQHPRWRTADSTVAAEVMIRHTISGNRARIACKIPCQIDYMNAKIDERTASGKCLVAKPTAWTAVLA